MWRFWKSWCDIAIPWSIKEIVRNCGNPRVAEHLTVLGNQPSQRGKPIKTLLHVYLELHIGYFQRGYINVYESVSKSQKLQIYINAHGVPCSWKFGPKQSLVRHSDETQTHKGQKLEPNILGRKRWVSVRLSCLLERKSWKKIVS